MKWEGRDAMKDYADLRSIEASDGWKLICSEYDERLAALTAKILSRDTPAHEAEPLRQARAAMVDAYSPAIILKQLLTKIAPRAEKQTVAAAGATAKE